MTALVFRQFGMNGTSQSGGGSPAPGLAPPSEKSRRSENPVKRLSASRIGQTLHSPGTIRQTPVLAVDRLFSAAYSHGGFSRFHLLSFTRSLSPRDFLMVFPAVSSPQLCPQPIPTGYFHGFFAASTPQLYPPLIPGIPATYSKGYPMTHPQSLSPLPFTQSCITPIICSMGSEQPFFSHLLIIAISPLI